MTDKPTIAAGYGGEQTELVRATCLYVATKLRDVMDELVVVGGLVPSLLVKQEDLSCSSQRDFQLRKMPNQLLSTPKFSEFAVAR